MAQELIFTSAPNGLKTGSSGYCTVAYTNGMPANIVKLLESFSDYSFLDLNNPKLDSSPVSYRHYRYTSGATILNVLSRVAYIGFDYTKRSNKLAHHLVLSSEERVQGGPAWLFFQNDTHDNTPLFSTEWTGEPRIIPRQRAVPDEDDSISVAEMWGNVVKGSADPGWAGVLAETFRNNPNTPSYLMYDIDQGGFILPLIREALALLPVRERWRVTFNTYFSHSQKMDCLWRCCLKDSASMMRAKGIRDALIIDLTSELPEASGGELVDVARGNSQKEISPPAGVSESLPETEVQSPTPKGGIAAFDNFNEGNGDAPEQNVPDAVSEVEPTTTDNTEPAQSIIPPVQEEAPSPVESTGEAPPPPSVEQPPPQKIQTPPVSSGPVTEPGGNSEVQKLKKMIIVFAVVAIVVILALVTVVILLIPRDSKDSGYSDEDEIFAESESETVQDDIKRPDERTASRPGKHKRKKPIKRQMAPGENGAGLAPDARRRRQQEKSSGDSKDSVDVKPVRKRDSGDESPENETPEESMTSSLEPDKLFWFEYLKIIRDENKKEYNIPVSGVNPGNKLTIVLKPGWEAKVEEFIAGSDDLKVSDVLKTENKSTCSIRRIYEDGLTPKYIPFLELKIGKNRISVKKMDGKGRQPVDLNSIASFKINNVLLPAEYNGDNPLPNGTGKINTEKEKEFRLEFIYNYKLIDRLSDVFPTKKKIGDKYKVQLVFNARDVNREPPKFEKDKIRYRINLQKSPPEIAKIVSGVEKAVKKDMDKLKKNISRKVKKLPRAIKEKLSKYTRSKGYSDLKKKIEKVKSSISEKIKGLNSENELLSIKHKAGRIKGDIKRFKSHREEVIEETQIDKLQKSIDSLSKEIVAISANKLKKEAPKLKKLKKIKEDTAKKVKDNTRERLKEELKEKDNRDEMIEKRMNHLRNKLLSINDLVDTINEEIDEINLVETKGIIVETGKGRKILNSLPAITEDIDSYLAITEKSKVQCINDKFKNDLPEKLKEYTELLKKFKQQIRLEVRRKQDNKLIKTVTFNE